jgi:exoribonuclease R
MHPSNLDNGELSELPESVSAKMKNAAAYYQSIGLTERYADIMSIIERFNMWANSIGAFHGTKDFMSLGYRIREAPKLKTLFCDILGDILEDINKRKPIGPIYGSKAHLCHSENPGQLK